MFQGVTWLTILINKRSEKVFIHYTYFSIEVFFSKKRSFLFLNVRVFTTLRIIFSPSDVSEKYLVSNSSLNESKSSFLELIMVENLLSIQPIKIGIND